MALIIEDGSIVTGADSYISVADAKAFLEAYYSEYDADTATYLGYSAARQEVILRRAAYDLDRKYRGAWKGFKCDEDQSLDWPREDVTDEDCYEVPADTIPRRIQRAQCEVAKRLAGDVQLCEDRARGGRVQSEKVDVLSVSYFADAPSATLFEGIEAVLRGLLQRANRIRRA